MTRELTVKEYAQAERVDERTVWRWIKKGAVRTRNGLVIHRPVFTEADRRGYTWSWFSGVYFVACEMFIKIGIAQDVRVRLRSLTGSNPFPLTPLGFIECHQAAIAAALEAELHEQFRYLRVRNEWFRDDPFIRAYINSQCAPWPAPRTKEPCEAGMAFGEKR